MRLRRGTTSVEFGMIIVVFFGMLFAIMDWGWYFFQRSQFMDAVLDGTRRAVTRSQSDATLDPANAAVQYTEENLTDYGMDPALTTISASYEGTTPSEVLIVDASMPFEPLIGLFTWQLPDTVSAEMSMYLEMQD